MTPQLYINYRLKSVAAMPGRAMTYKFLNTIIDDIFSFVVKMPTLHRLACFRCVAFRGARGRPMCWAGGPGRAASVPLTAPTYTHPTHPSPRSDDVIFLVYLAQRWLYPVDKSRKNEFGASGLDYENAEARRRGLKRTLGRAKLERRPGPYAEERPEGAAAAAGRDGTGGGGAQ